MPIPFALSLSKCSGSILRQAQDERTVWITTFGCTSADIRRIYKCVSVGFSEILTSLVSLRV